MAILSADQSRQARKEFGLSQADVAEATGLKRQYLSEFESETAQRFTSAQLRKLRTFYENKLEEARAAGEEIELTFGDAEETPAASIEAVKAKRFFFPVADEVSDETLASTLANIRANDKKLAESLATLAERESSLFGEGDYTEEVLQAIRESLSLLAANYLQVRAIGGWPEIGLSASNDKLSGNDVLAAIIASMTDNFAAAGLLGSAAVEGEEKERRAV
ncbi:conserved protein of unknown function [Georgfuchsia toluolica]|uniref:HTH cro/C1-type domain-containing protein n=1 Tax=Georgfuchsia toluolica TaxID=424218 RepID=A0A916J4B6_9PROT|nr:helix-turn-helix transcriptional regulator [Georgfuchsia toluolica]CAG4883712.1 conserved protein of unknown function [Georgfuchsia toluolica]